LRLRMRVGLTAIAVIVTSARRAERSRIADTREEERATVAARGSVAKFQISRPLSKFLPTPRKERAKWSEE